MIAVITPCSRPENLNEVEQSMLPFKENVNWHICYDLSKVNSFRYENATVTGIAGGVSGNAQRNHALEFVTEDWVYILDDDNAMHPDFSLIIPYLYANSVHIYTFDQQLKDSVRRGNRVEVGAIDQAQFLIRREIMIPYEQDYNADGLLIKELVNKYRHNWIYLPFVMSYYNKLTW